MLVGSWLVVASIGQAQEWSAQSDKNGIEVHTAPMDGSKYNQFRGRGVVPGTVDAVLAEVLDVGDYQEWFPDVPASKLLDKEGDVIRYYVVTAMPWPVNDRDAIYQYTVTRSGETARIAVRGLPDSHPKQDGYVRMVSQTGQWTLEPAEGGTRVTWQLHVEPGGNVPAWAANRSIVNIPRNMIESLRKRMTKAD